MTLMDKHAAEMARTEAAKMIAQKAADEKAAAEKAAAETAISDFVVEKVTGGQLPGHYNVIVKRQVSSGGSGESGSPTKRQAEHEGGRAPEEDGGVSGDAATLCDVLFGNFDSDLEEAHSWDNPEDFHGEYIDDIDDNVDFWNAHRRELTYDEMDMDMYFRENYRE